MQNASNYQSDTPDVHNGVTTDYHDLTSTNLQNRWLPLLGWLDARLENHLDPYSKYTASTIAPECTAFDRGGRPLSGINLASQDYLNLASHPKILSVARQAITDWGIHSAGSAALMGLTELTVRLEKRIAKFLQMEDATIFPTGWGAGYGAIRTLITPNDHIVIDVLAHACLQEAATVSTPNVHRFPHCSNSAVERRLKRIRAEDKTSGILVVTETVFSMDSDSPDIRKLQALCNQYDATLFVDVAHDFGAMGETGRGILEMQDMVGSVDIVMGAFSKVFASNGGFVATKNPALKLAMRYGSGPLTFSNAMSPFQAAIILACFDVIESQDGAKRRTALMANSVYLRNSLRDHGFNILGEPSAIVPVILGSNSQSRVMTREILNEGALVNLVEFPAVSKNSCRWRLQVMSEHTTSQLDRFVDLAVAVRSETKI